MVIEIVKDAVQSGKEKMGFFFLKENWPEVMCYLTREKVILLKFDEKIIFDFWFLLPFQFEVWIAILFNGHVGIAAICVELSGKNMSHRTGQVEENCN